MNSGYTTGAASGTPERPGPHARLGSLLRQANLVTEDQLAEALQIQAQTGERLGKILVRSGYINRLTLAQLLAEQLRLPFYNLLLHPPSAETVRLLDESTARRLEAVPVQSLDGHVTVAFADPLDVAAVREVEGRLGRPIHRSITSEYDIHWILERVYRQEYVLKSARELLYRQPEESAAETFTTPQLVTLLALLLVGLACLVWQPMATLIALNALSTLVYLLIATYRLFLMYRGATHNLTISAPPEQVASLKEKELPAYTLLVPIYREKEVLPILLRAIENLDYPPSKLDVKLLFEETDPETFQAAKALRPPAYFQFVVVPESQPRTKPKACNYGLIQATGQYCVIYDAEDIPEPKQLKTAIVAFRRAPKDVVCLQAKLNYYNRDQNLLTSWFTSEYSMWFDIFLLGLDATRAPIPLGGTSNHFITERLRSLGAWDPYNVTEDADLGIRLHKAGYRTAILDSTTFEEANSDLVNWMRQRSRWVKGYMQTWLVHMRHPFKLIRTIGIKAFFSFQMTVGGTVFTFLLNPILWALTTLWFLSRWDLIPQTFPPQIYYLAAFCLLIGNFVFMYLNVAGSYMRGYYELVRYALISPVYWVLMSVAAWRGFYQLMVRPSYWEKTLHGLHLHVMSPDSYVGK